jgi:VWFA-related protein
MPKLTHKTLLYGAAGALGGSAAWAFVLALSHRAAAGVWTEVALGAVTGAFIGAFIWSHEAITGRQFGVAVRRAAYGAGAGIAGGALGAGLGTLLFSFLGVFAADLGGFRASFGVIVAVALGWTVLGSAIGVSGGLMVRSTERARYGLIGGSLGGMVGGLVSALLPATSPWAVLAGLSLLGLSIGSFISLVEEAFISAKVRVIKGRHINREFPLLKERNVVGRDDRADVCLSGAEGVLLEHAAIKRSNGHYTIEMGIEGKPVYINQRITTNSRLADGDVIRVGSVLLLFSAVKKAAVIAAIVLQIGLSFTPAQAAEPASAQITQFDLSAFPTVRAFVSVLDADGRPVAGLSREQMTLFENGRPAAVSEMRMAGTTGARDALSLGIVVDRSASMAGEKIDRAREAVNRFLSLMEPGDRASLIAFSDTVVRLEQLTDNLQLLRHAAGTVLPEGHTALFDAVAEGAATLRGIDGRKAVIVLTDGIANRGALNIDQAIAAAVKDSASVYVIGLGKDVRAARLERIAGETGGTYFFTPAPDGLLRIYETISSRIRNEYVVTFDTEKRAEYLRTVEFGLSTGQQATRGYFQPASSLFGSGLRPPAWAFAMPFLSLLGIAAASFRKVEQQYRTGHLSLVRGRGTTKNVDIGRTVTIGLDSRSAVGLFKDGGIGPQHAEVVRENGQYVIDDKGTATGTYVNKQRVTGRQTLRDGDVIDVGNATIVFSEPTLQACRGCGAALRPGAKFCAKCGAKTA